MKDKALIDSGGECILECEIDTHITDTKTTLLPDATTVVWRVSDKISVIPSSGDACTFRLASGSGTTSGRFTGSMEATAPFTAFYPASGNPSVAEGVLSFHLPESQVYVKDSFGEEASPMVASVVNESSPIAFKNICGVLCLKLTMYPSFRLSRLVISDPAGHMLWGDCTLKLDGNEGTEGQTMGITGGSNEITLSMSSPLSFSESKPVRFYVVVPPGSFSNGFSVTVYDDRDEVRCSFETSNEEAVIKRSRITNMKQYAIKAESPDPGRRGYYKDAFMNSGIHLSSPKYLAAFPYIGWDYEYFCTPFTNSWTEEDTALQNCFFYRAEDDENGYLLYPDRQPRYRCIYVNGGHSVTHGQSLGTNGRKTICDFFYNGGSYVGSCGGAFLAHKYLDHQVNPRSEYLSIIPGRMITTGLGDAWTDMEILPDSPMRNYFTFEDIYPHIIHSQGGYMPEPGDADWVPGTEILARYANCPPGKEADNGRISTIAYKPSDATGRMVLTGSHPELGKIGDARNFFSAMLLYAADGSGKPPVKAELNSGVLYDCTAMSSANTPKHARIGDKQYHHFIVTIPAGVTNLKIDLNSTFVDDDLFLSVRKGDYAWFSEADYTLTTQGSSKTLNVPDPDAGTWYISVYAPNTVKSTVVSYGENGTGGYYKYIENTHLLNGIPYTIMAKWEGGASPTLDPTDPQFIDGGLGGGEWL